jgi:hypothetical protein
VLLGSRCQTQLDPYDRPFLLPQPSLPCHRAPLYQPLRVHQEQFFPRIQPWTHQKVRIALARRDIVFSMARDRVIHHSFTLVSLNDNRFCTQLLQSLELLSKHKVVHCDLKPEVMSMFYSDTP